MSHQEPQQGFDSITRVEIIDESGRAYVNWNNKNKIQVFIQDEGKTLKIQISLRED